MQNKPKQLKLFRQVDDADMIAFQNAKKIKDQALQHFKSYDFEDFMNDNTEHLIIKFDANIKQIRDQNALDEIRIFLRKIESRVSLWHYSKGVPNKIVHEPLNELTDERILPNWGHSIYTEKKISLELFLNICKQNYGFRFAVTILKDNIEKLIPDQYKDLKSIIYFNHKLLPYNETLSESSYLSAMENQSEKDFIEITKLASIKKWYMVGNFLDFTDENSLVKELDIIFEKTSSDVSFYKLYSSDFLFLNNVEFLSERPNSLHLSSGNVIFSPTIIKDKTVLKDSNLYFYTRDKKDSAFYRNEIVMADINYENYFKLGRICENSQEFLHIES